MLKNSFRSILLSLVAILSLFLLQCGSDDGDSNDGKPIIVQSWAIFAKNFYDLLEMNVPFDKMDQIHLPFTQIKEGELYFGDPDYVNKIGALREAYQRKNPNAKFIVESAPGADADYKSAVENPSGFAESVLSLLQQYEFDGFGMDWEGGSTPHAEPDGVNTLLKALHDKLHDPIAPKRYLLVLIADPDPWLYLKEDTVNYVDQIIVMNYGTRGTDCVDEFHTFFPKGPSQIPYSKLFGAIDTEWDSEMNQQAYEESQETIEAKCKYAKQKGLGGMYEWRLDCDCMHQDGSACENVNFQGADWLWQYCKN